MADELSAYWRNYCLTNPTDTSCTAGADQPPPASVLAVQALGQINFPTPVPQLGPDPLHVAVNTWTYLWVNDPGTLTATAAVPGLSVTATAELTSTTWSTGEPVDLDHVNSRVPAFDCEGAGEPAQPGWEQRATYPAASTCVYDYQWRSTTDRTADGTWPLIVTTTWSITWTATNGITGTATRAQTSAPLDVHVGEWQAVLIPADPALPADPPR